MDCVPFSPYSSCSYVAQIFLMLGITFAGAYYLYVNYAADRSPHVLVISAIAAVFVAAGGVWANANAATVPGALWYEWLLWGLLGVGIGVSYVSINYGARPASARSGTQILFTIVLAGGIGVLVYLGRLHDLLQEPPPDVVAVATIGALVGISELVSRYRDEPTRALFTMPAVLYVALNAIAALLALGIGGVQVANAGEPGVLGVHWGLVLACGLGAMAILRSALFVVRTDGKDLQVGPGSLVQMLLDAADRALDRLRAEERAWTVAKLMETLTSRVDGPPKRHFGAMLAGMPPRRRVDDEVFRLVVVEAVAQLPAYCITLTQNLDADDRTTFLSAASALSGDDAMSDEVKLFTLGLLAMNSVGPRVLGAAVASLGPDLLRRAETRAEAEARAQQVEDGTTQTAQQAQVAADAARTAANTAKTEGASPMVQAATAQAADAAGQAARSASATQQAASGLTESVVAAAEPGPAVVVPAQTQPPADAPTDQEPSAAATNGVHVQAAGVGASDGSPPANGASPAAG